MDLQLRRRLPMLCRSFWRGLVQRIAIDTRSLAVFRILMGALLVADIILRSERFQYFYTESGVMPLEEALVHAPENAFSFYFLTTDPTVTMGLFIIQALVGIQLIVGYKTRIATILAFLFVLSLQHRNVLALSYADTLYRLLLFWAMFLPLGERWSIDAVHRVRLPREQISSIASALILCLMISMYFVNWFHKSGGELWATGDATRIIMGISEITHFLGPYMGHLPPVILEAGTHFWYYLLFSSFLLLFATGRRRTLVVGLFIFGHTAFVLTARIGAFPYVSYAGLVLFLQAQFWTDIKRLSEYTSNQSSEIFKAINRSSVQLAQKLPHRQKRNQTLAELKSIIGTMAIIAVVMSLVVGVGTVALVSSGVSEESPMPEQIGDTANSFGLFNPAWDIFAPDPRSYDRYYIVAAETTEGEHIELYNGGELSKERPYDQLHNQHETYRERFYMGSVVYMDENDERNLTATSYQKQFAEYHCDLYGNNNEDHITHINMYYVIEEITIDTVLNVDDRETELTEVFRYGCGDNEPKNIDVANASA